MIKYGDWLDPLVTGSKVIDLKELFVRCGYLEVSLPKVPMKIDDLPADVKALYEEITSQRDAIQNLEPVEFVCHLCDTRNSSVWRKMPTGEEFYVCGGCDHIVGLR